MATTMPEAPAFVDKTLDLAKEAGWTVARRNATFTLIPPDGVKAQRIMIKRTPPPTGEQLAILLKTKGFTRHVTELGLTGEPGTEPEPEKAESQKTEPEPEAPKPLICPECSKPFTRGAAMGAHRSRTHGVKGANAKRKKVSGVKAASATPAAPAAGLKAAPDPIPAQRQETPPSALEQHVKRFTAQVHRTALALCEEVTSEMSRTIAEKDEQIEALTAEVKELQSFKEAVLGAVSGSQTN
ncbi:hypothetical protein [Streptomyces sp. NPDC018055]|uniref:hypothetical protein n=1 Tax=Streptomyces sp. NPDC018055 TaxID=3365038 RepID=UPI003798FA9B